jgi:antitoxin component YwqK of YwqJK toxin-antitoxin module
MRKFALFASLFVWSLLFGNDDELIEIDRELLHKERIDGEGFTFFTENNQTFSGKSVSKDENGSKQNESSFKDGKLHGAEKNYFPDGIICTEIQWSEGRVVGAKSWKHDGSPCDVTKVLNGDGVIKRYYANNNTHKLSNLKGGRRHGIQEEWHENGKKESEVNYKDGKAEGLATWWYENGQKKAEGNFKDGKQDGLTTLWYDNGQKKEEVNYKDGKKEGLGTWWHDNGQKRKESNWKDGKLDGTLKAFNENGKEYLRRIYNNGTLVLEKKHPE